ncbi:MAG: subtilisin family serine protease [Crocinitomix sp.]|jgi:subtilisin family serine protease
MELRKNEGKTPSGSTVDRSKLLLSFKDDIQVGAVTKLIAKFGLRVIMNENYEKSNKHWIAINNNSRRYWVQSDAGAINTEEIFALKKALDKQLEWIGLVFQDEGAAQNIRYSKLPHALLFKITPKNERKVQALARKMGMLMNKEKTEYLNGFLYYEVKEGSDTTAYAIMAELESNLELKGKIFYENMPMMKPFTAIPNDTFYANQWNMTQIQAPNAWDISTGDNSVVVCVIDQGCDQTHPDLQFSSPGINLGTMLPPGSPTGPHGTACAGIAAATINNAQGVAGLAGSCLILPVAMQNSTDAEIAAGINYAVANGADVISMSFGVYNGWGWNYAVIDPAINNAFTNDLVLCAATGNEDIGTTNRYPGRHNLVMAIGGSDQADNRKSAASPDGECWGANFGQDVYNGVATGVSVVAPCVIIPTTDIQAAGGYYNGVGPLNWSCVNYPVPGSADGNYLFIFNGTSAATPHVAGLAGLIRSEYPALSNLEIRNIIERTADKVGVLPYADQAGFQASTRNQEMGYGRINAFKALNFADVMIKDWASDDGTEPSTPPGGNFWTFSDIVVRPQDDSIFLPYNTNLARQVERGQTNYIYVKVTNNGPRPASTVNVNFRITPYVGAQFVYPQDWTLIDAMHVAPTSLVNNFALIPAGGEVIAKFSVTAAQVETLWGWQTANPWHPCLLAEVDSDNDYARQTSDLSFGNVVLRKSNFAQRNLTVVDYVLGGGKTTFPFVAGSKFSKARKMNLVVVTHEAPKGVIAALKLDNNEKAFPEVDFTNPRIAEDKGNTIYFESRGEIRARLGNCDALFTMEKGSKIDLLCKDGRELNVLDIKGGKLVKNEKGRFVELRENYARIEMEITPESIYALGITFAADRKARGKKIHYSVYQEDEQGNILGGADAIFMLE